MAGSYYESDRDSMTRPHAWYVRCDNFPPHFHAGIELSFVLEGELTAAVDGEVHKVRAGQLLANNCYSVHAYSSTDCYSIVAIIPLGVVPSIQKLLTSNRFRRNVIDDDDAHTLENLMRMMVDADDNEILQKGLSYALLGILTRRIPLDPVSSGDHADAICGILNYLNDSFTQRLTVEQVAARFGYSRSRFSHLFKSTVGYSLPQYLNLLRCRSVCELMMTSDKPIVDLAVSAGFNNTHTFYSAFKAHYHMTPREYILNRQNAPEPKKVPESAEAPYEKKKKP